MAMFMQLAQGHNVSIIIQKYFSLLWQLDITF